MLQMLMGASKLEDLHLTKINVIDAWPDEFSKLGSYYFSKFLLDLSEVNFVPTKKK